jgi:hypothetical protein
MKGRRQKKAYEYLKWIRDNEKEIKALERLWELGIVKWRDERQYKSETEPFSYLDADIKLNVLRVIR